MVKTFILQSLWPYFVIVVGAFDAYDETVGYNTSTVAVIRRISNDVYYQATCHCHTWCDDNTTYLVAEEQCVDNSNFYNVCSFAITPTGEPHQLRLTIDSVNGSRLQTVSGTKMQNATVVVISTKEQVNSSVCHISSLEVYRGEGQTTKISHQGFSLGSSGTIEINQGLLLQYKLTEYVGELYRMNVSCINNSDYREILPTNGCLFFKVSGNTTITDAKFNCKVPGTVHSISDCVQTTMTPQMSNPETTTLLQSLQSSSPMTTTPTVTEGSHTNIIIGMSNNNRPVLETGGPLFYGLVAAGSAIILILLLCVIGVSILACRRQYDISHSEKQGQPIYEDIDIRNGRTAIANPGYNNDLANANTMNGSGDPTRAAEYDFTSHTYQEIGATYQEIMPVAKGPNRAPQWGMTNPSLFLDQLNLEKEEEKEIQEYNTLNHTGGHNAVNHCNESTIVDSEQYAKLDVAG